MNTSQSDLERKYLSKCSFCGLEKSEEVEAFCTNCGRPLLEKTLVRSMDLSKTTANYDPYHPAWKPWKEPSNIRKKVIKPKHEAFYNKIPWGKNAPPPRPMPSKKIKGGDNESTEDPSEAKEIALSDQHEYNGIKFKGFYWRKPSGALMRRKKRPKYQVHNNNEPILNSDIISPVAVYQAPWISPTAVIHVSHVESIRASKNKNKDSVCWFRIGVTDSTWTSPSLLGASSPLDSAATTKTVDETLYNVESADLFISLQANSAESQLQLVPSESFDLSKFNKSVSTLLDDDSKGIVISSDRAELEEFEDFLDIQHVNSHVAKFIVGDLDNWVDANLVDSTNTYMLNHLQRALEPLARRVVPYSSRLVEQSFDQLSFLNAIVIENYAQGATLTMFNYFPFDNQAKGSGAGARTTDQLERDSSPSSIPIGTQLYFDQTIIQTTVRIPIGGSYRGDFLTCLVRVEPLNAAPNYVSDLCRRLDVPYQKVSATPTEEINMGNPSIAALKFLIIPLIMREKIRPKILVFDINTLAVLLEKDSIDLMHLMSREDVDHDCRHAVMLLCLQVIEAIRFEKVRYREFIETRVVVAGVPNSFEVVDPDDLDNDMSSTEGNGDIMKETESADEDKNADSSAVSAIRIQHQWRLSLARSEKRRDQEMKWNLALSVIKIQCMFRSFRARKIKNLKRQQLHKTLVASRIQVAVGQPSPPAESDDIWRALTDKEMVRIGELRGTSLMFKATVLDSNNEPIPPCESLGAWKFIKLSAMCLNTEKGQFPAIPTTELKLSKDRLSNGIYRDYVSFPPEYSQKSFGELDILTILTNIMPHLDLFYAGKKGIMILKFNGPQEPSGAP